MEKIISEGEWLTEEEVNSLQLDDWKRHGQVFSVNHAGADLYPRYQFDAIFQPLPVIVDIIFAFGEHANPWKIAAWMHFPNSWLSTTGPDGVVPVAPKDCLDRRGPLMNALSRREGTYVA